MSGPAELPIHSIQCNRLSLVNCTSMIHKLLARALPPDFFIRHRAYFEAWQTIHLTKREAAASDVSEAVKMLVPVGSAPSLIRIGGDKDGAYLIPNDLAGIAACFSPGTDTKIAFERELAQKFGIRSLMCDGSVDASRLDLIEGMNVFKKVWLRDFDDSTTYSLNGWVELSDVPQDKDLILQIDIEGGEYAALLYTSQSVLKRFRIIAMEIHLLDQLDDTRFLNLNYMPLMQKLTSIFDLVHAHPNNCHSAIEISGILVPPVMELTFLRKDRNLGTKQKSLLPHPLDIVNVPHKPIIGLGWPWIQSESRP